MKKKNLSFLLMFVAVTAFSQTELGLKLAPVIASNRVTNDLQTVDSDGSALKFSVGLVVDKVLSEDNYIFSSGLIYVPKQASFRTSGNDSISSESYTLQYLQVPLTLKLFTNEVAPDVKAYFQVGGGFEVKVYEESDDPDNIVVESFQPVEMSVILGSGIEYNAGINTTIFAGVSYQRGLTNTVNNTLAGYDDIQIRNTIFSIDFGVKF